MPPRNRPQNNAMLYTLITFVGLFIIATTAAVIYYVKFEDETAIANQAKRDLSDLATSMELRKIATIVGAKQRRKTRLRTMVDYLNEMVNLIVGGPAKDTSAEEKVITVSRKVKNMLELLAKEYPDIGNIDPNAVGLIQIVENLKTKLDNTTKASLDFKKQLEDLHKQFSDALAISREKEQKLLAEKKKYEQQVNEIKQKYGELEAFLRKNTQQQIQDLMAQLEQVKTERDNLETKMQQTGAELLVAKERIALLEKRIQVVMPPPDSNAPAYKPDGKVILIDNQIVHLDIGRDDHVYRGLTFTVYDKGMPIPKDGKGKAEIEVFDVEKNIAAARITHSQIKNPIVVNDVVANLIWDSDKTNVFVIAGEFDLNNDGHIDYDAVDKIKTLIGKWGGRVTDSISVDTDFLVLGRPPQIPQKPTFEQIETDPLAMQKYQASLQKLDHYNQTQKQARALRIPVFSTERFLYFIGYKTLAKRPGAF